MEAKNGASVHQLNIFGYNGRQLQVKLKEKNVSVKSKRTQTYSRDCTEALSKCVTHCDQFLAPDDMHLTPDYAFKAAEMRLRTLKVEYTKCDKAAILSLIRIEK